MVLKNLEGLSPEIQVTNVLIALAVISLEIWRRKHMKSQGNNLRKETQPYSFVDDMIVQVIPPGVETTFGASREIYRPSFHIVGHFNFILD